MPGTQKLGKDQEGFFSVAFGGSKGLPTLSVRIYTLELYKIGFLLFQLTHLYYFVRVNTGI
jgi:hypothetical protein